MRSSKHNHWRIWSSRLLGGVLAAVLTSSNAHAISVDDLALGWMALDDETLDDLRGGFLGDSGFQIALAFESVVSVDGNLQTRTVLNIPGIDLGVGGSSLNRAQFASLEISQTGLDNAISTRTISDLSSGLNTIVQNALDNQVIQHSKILNIELSRMGSLGNTGLRSKIMPELIESLR